MDLIAMARLVCYIFPSIESAPQELNDPIVAALCSSASHLPSRWREIRLSKFALEWRPSSKLERLEGESNLRLKKRLPLETASLRLDTSALLYDGFDR